MIKALIKFGESDGEAKFLLRFGVVEKDKRLKVTKNRCSFITQ